MPINFPTFQGGQVPQPRPIQPLQQPQHYDPASIIMQAAALRQEKELAQQKLQQELAGNLLSSVQTAASLQEQKRQHDMENARAQATLGVQQGKLESEAPFYAAHAKAMEAQASLYEIQAKMLGGAGTGYADSMKKVHEGTMPPSEFFNGFTSRTGQRAAMQNLYNQIYPSDNITLLENNYTASKSAAQTSGATPVQVPIAMAKGVQSLTSDLAERAANIGFTRFPVLNKAIIAYKTSTGDPDMRDYLLRNVEAQKQLAQVFQAGGVPTDFAGRSAAEALPPETGPDALRRVTSDTIPAMIQARIGALKSINPAGALIQPAVPQGAGKMRVRRKSDGTTGLVSPGYNTSIYEAL